MRVTLPSPLTALIVLTTLTCAAACSTIPTRGAPGTVVDERETGSADRALRLEGMEVRVMRDGQPYPPYLLDVKAFPKDDGARFGVVMVNDELRYQECRQVELFAGDKRVPLRRIEYRHTRGSTGWFEGWWIDVGPDSLAKLAAATRVGGVFCEAEVWLDEAQRAVLKDFVVRLLP